MNFKQLVHLLESTESENFLKLREVLATFGFNTKMSAGFWLNLSQEENTTFGLIHLMMKFIPEFKTNKQKVTMIMKYSQRRSIKSGIIPAGTFLIDALDHNPIYLSDADCVEKTIKKLALISPHFADAITKTSLNSRKRAKQNIAKLNKQAQAYLDIIERTDTIEQQELGEI